MKALSLALAAAVAVGCTRTDAAGTGCNDLDGAFKRANAAYDASRFREASAAFVALAGANERCNARTLTPGIRQNVAEDYLSAGEAAHQAGDDERARRLVGEAVSRFALIVSLANPNDDDYRYEIDRSIARARSDLAGAWTQHPRQREGPSL